jgi:hypothetical protein
MVFELPRNCFVCPHEARIGLSFHFLYNFLRGALHASLLAIIGSSHQPEILTSLFRRY